MIPLFKPSLGKEELTNLEQVFNTGYITLGPKTKEFEERFAAYVGTPYAVGTSSCTIALQMALDVLKVKGGEVCVPPLTFVSTVTAAVYNQATPVYVDVDPDTLCMDPADLEKKITKKTKAIIPVHYGGHPCDMDRILAIAKAKNIPVLEDCAHTGGAYYKNKQTGSFGDMGCFSFHAVKPLAAGDGGMVTTHNENYARQLGSLRWLGASKDTYQRDKKGYDWYYEISCLGYKGYMNDITAAIAMAQLEKLESMNERRRKIADLYNEAFKGLDWLKTPVIRSYAKSSHHNYATKIDTERISRDDFMEHLKSNGISSGVHYMPIYQHPYYRVEDPRTPVAESVWQKIVLLPLFSSMTESEIQQVIDAVTGYAKIKKTISV
ncbi:MAG: DegT/DnrJ/EryC1/StrS family aminotransferase [Candidatus Omnitrophica bacterium]|nr:DegT/DnrJ/EryC1/StrS family aminotransferase [Candidatus Omnitrophota bacterium]